MHEASSMRMRRSPPFLLLFLPQKEQGAGRDTPLWGGGRTPLVSAAAAGPGVPWSGWPGGCVPRDVTTGSSCVPSSSSSSAWMRRQCHLLGPQNGVLYTDVRLGTPAPCSSLVPRQNGCKGQGETAPMRSGETSPKHPQCSKCCCRCLFRAQLLGMVSPDPKGPMP